MKGTEKQIAWAEEIKARVLAIVKKAHAEMKATPHTEEQEKMMNANVEGVVNHINSIDTASKMIEMFKNVRESASVSDSFGMIVSAVMRDVHKHW